MPFHKQYSKRYRKRTKKRVTRAKRRVPRPRLQVGFPLKYRCKLRYTDVITLDPGTNTTAEHAFRCNNVFDPDATGAGHQVRHFDMLAEVYTYYVVTSSKITAKVVGYDAAGGDAAQALGIRASQDSLLQVPNVDLPALVEMGRTAQMTYTMVKSTEPLQTRAISKSWSQARFKSINGAVADDVLTGTTTGSGPSRQDYFCLFATGASLDTAGNPRRLNIMVSVDYVVTFHGIKGNLPED